MKNLYVKFKNIAYNKPKKYILNKKKSLEKEIRRRYFIQPIAIDDSVYRNEKVTAEVGLQKLLRDYKFNSVLDVGSGEGKHSDIFRSSGKEVTSLDYGYSPYFERSENKNSCIIGDYNKYVFDKKFDCIWASHILEHQISPHDFLKKTYNDLNDGGVLAITVPPMKPRIVGGHVNLFNPGLLIYRVILAGFNCQNASLLWYGYNITLIVKKEELIDLSNLTYDKDDIGILKDYFPLEIQEKMTTNFDGNIRMINW